MPIFEYVCKDCNHSFEALVYGSQKADCPKCHSKKLAPQLSVFASPPKALPPQPPQPEAVAAVATRAAPAPAP
jgi:putative FmdB family regulatory protein